MAKVISESGWNAEERNKYEQHNSVAINSDGDRLPPGNPYVYRHYPKMLYQARKRDDGRIMCVDPMNEQWSRGNFQIVNSEAEHKRYLDQGWRDTQKEALDRAESFERDISTAAAHRAHEDRNMSDRAKAEVAEAEEATGSHVPEVKRKYTRRKAVAAS